MGYPLSELQDTELWKAFESRAGVDQQKMVIDLSRRAADRLDLVRDTFPTYTLHNRVHALNVIRLMGRLLGPDVQKLSALEGAILILSAYYHDIGMVFDEEERRNLAGELEFARFVSSHPEAAVRIGGGGDIPVDVAEAYCRWIHPDRVYKFLRSVPEDELRWGGTPILLKLGAVCQSHGYDVKDLKKEVFQTDFRNEADLRFCAIMLRLGDILDFDNSRSPEEVYRYLGLGKRDEPRKEASDVEWRKHLALEGFSFPPERGGARYALKVLASPDHPAVEYDVRQFLDIIEGELQQCTSLLAHCSDRWRGFRLPTEIDRSDIVSKGYKYGEYRFTLEQKRILELLMGENLYEDTFVFIRELLQNAIDTTRHRLYFERSRGHAAFRPDPIVVSTWLDEDSYQWVRIDDFGMGMSEEIICKFFLKVGESYYRSAQFRAEMLGYERKGQAEFVPISRFGIGVLSCFIAGDRVHVSTRHAGGGPEANSVRLQLSGLHSFYVLQSERDLHYNAEPMPRPRDTPGMGGGYRQGDGYGTSIAVRLDPRKESRRLNLKEVLERYVLCPPVPVLFEGEEVGGDRQALVQTPWAEGVIEEELTQEEIAELEYVFDFEFADPLKVRLIPLDLTKHSPTPDVQGQALLGHLVMSTADALALEAACEYGGPVDRNDNERIDWSFSFRVDDEGPRISAEFRDPAATRLYALYARSAGAASESAGQTSEPAQPEEGEEFSSPPVNGELARLVTDRQMRKAEEAEMGREAEIELSRLFERIRPYIGDFIQRVPASTRDWLTHNGIVVPTLFGNDSYAYLRLAGNSGHGLFWLRSLVALSDSLRPDISLSRDRLKYLTWNVYSAVTLAFRNALRSYADATIPLASGEIFDRIVANENYLLGNILEDPLIALKGGWAAQDIISTKGGMTSLEKIRAGLAGTPPLVLNNLPDMTAYSQYLYVQPRFAIICASSLVQIGLKVSLRRKRNGPLFECVVESFEAPVVREGQKLFPPLFFIAYEQPDVLRHLGQPLNQLHPFAEWLIENAVTIHEKYPGIFEAIRRGVLTPAYQFEKGKLEELNETLDRLWVLDEHIRPPKRFRLTMEDFGHKRPGA